MSDGRKYYCMCDSNCKFETMTKEQILAAIAQAMETGVVGDVDTGFVTKLKELNTGSAVTVWVGTRAQYNAITEKAGNCLYIITDDTTSEDIVATCEAAVAAAEEAQVQAAAAAGRNKGVNFTSSVKMTYAKIASDIGDDASVSATPVLFMYNPSTGIVQYVFELSHMGSFNEGENIKFWFKNLPYQPKDIVKELPAVTTSKHFSGCISPAYAGDFAAADFSVEESFNDSLGWSSATFSGWYYAGVVEE